jgi:hypothetical protein
VGVIVAGIVASLLLGSALWFYAHRPLDNWATGVAQANAFLAGMTVAALLSVFPRWWGLTLLLDAVILLVIGVIIVEFILFPQR